MILASPGSRTVKTEPLPGSLATVTSPPIMRASLRERANGRTNQTNQTNQTKKGGAA